MESNPFASDKIQDPFEDPTVLPSSKVFAEESAYVAPAKNSKNSKPKSYSGSAYEDTKSSKPKSYTGSAYEDTGSAYTRLSDEGSGREAELSKKERELLERERMLEVREAKLNAGGPRTKDYYNWPSKCYPLAYHSITDEIPPQHRNLVRWFYFIVFASWLGLFWNWLTMLVIWANPDANLDTSDTDALWSTIFFACGIPGAWKLWYRSIYFAIRDNSGPRWIFFFLNFLAHIVFGFMIAIGVPDVAAGGLFVMSTEFSRDEDLVGFFCLVDMCLWTVIAFISIYLLRLAHRVWRGTGGPAKIQQEATQAIINEGIRQQGYEPPTSV